MDKKIDYEPKETIKSIIINALPVLIILGLLIFGCALALDYKNEKSKYDTAVIICDQQSIVVHIDHYESNDDRYIIYDVDGSIYNADKQYVVFYNSKE